MKDHILGPVFGKDGLFWYLDINGKEEGPFITFDQASQALYKEENRLNTKENVYEKA